ncbi:PREDICTED: protein NipSnap-like [Priapulus caudatus]|uniref:Protein NipSnap-like n=1 Tax=Priapulus caudatus TaxID=37621 RepID=A0ABM1DVS5_PRICU|nr:PREDICTED: protein NipSnap-like [Priapulus caudatus]XP_014664046.1 PREDICTED: protein NipSnap-like [Priapulus caudatus]
MAAPVAASAKAVSSLLCGYSTINLSRHIATSPSSFALRKLFDFSKVDSKKEQASAVLADKEHVFELQYHLTRPERIEEYMGFHQKFVETVKERNDLNCELLGSWSTMVGDEDEFVHLWVHNHGFEGVSQAQAIIRSDAVYVEQTKTLRKLLRSRSNQLLLEFTFWPKPEPRPPKHIYELRSYMLKAGTMIEWAHSWSRGLESRQANNEPVAGFFTNIGVIHNVHHLWAYDDLQSRKETREAAWQKPGWDKCVQYTVPLMKQVQSRILLPTPYSPLQ